jgi:RHS repeat-associated protein
LGSVREAVSRSGGTATLQSRFQYDLFGRKTVVQSGGASIDPTRAFAGLYENGSILLALNRAYDSDLGRWLSRDPIGEPGGLNLFSYAGNNPVNEIDLDGLCPQRGWILSEGQYRDPNTGKIHGPDGKPLRDQLNPFNPENFQDFGESSPSPFRASSLPSLSGSTPNTSRALVPKGSRSLGRWGETRLLQELNGQGFKPSRSLPTSLGPRFPDRLLDGISHEAKGGLNVKLNPKIERQILKDAELIQEGVLKGAHWHFFQGASPDVIEFLQRFNGITFTVY